MIKFFHKELLTNSTEPKYPFVRCNLKTPNIDFDVRENNIMATITQQIMAKVVDMADEEIVRAVCVAAASEGVADLFLIDKDFIMSAIRNEMCRRKSIQTVTREPSCSNCKQSEWISVEERLPEKDGKYLVYDLWQHRGISSEEIRITYFKRGDRYHEYMWKNHFSHWMPLPEAPKKERNHDQT